MDTTLRMILLGEDRGAGKTLKDTGKDADSAKKSLQEFGSGLSEAGSGMSKLMTIAGAAGPALMAAGAALSSAAAGGVALAAAIGPAAAAGAVAYVGVLGAVKSGALVTKFALQGISQAVAGNQKAMAALTPEGQRLARTLIGLKPEMEGVRAQAQKGLFPGLVDAANMLGGKYLPLIRQAAGETGSALGGLASQGAQMAATGPWRRDFGTLTQANATNISLLGRAGLFLADAARSLLVTAAPLTNAFSGWAVGAAKATDEWVQAKRATGELDVFWQHASETGHTLGGILGNLAVSVGNIFKIGSGGAGAGLLQTVEQLTANFRAWTTSASGAEAIAQWFATGRNNLMAMGRLVHDVLGGMSTIGSGQALAPLIDQLRTEVLPPLMEFLHNASAAGALQALVHAVAQVVQVFADLSASDSSLKAFATTLGILATSAGWIVEHVPGASQALAAFFIAMGASQALQMVGLGKAVTAVGSSLGSLALRLIGVTAAENTETAAVASNTLAHQISTSTLGTWIGVKAIEFGAWIRATAAAGASTVATWANIVAVNAAGLAVMAWEGAQWLLNAALLDNPIGLVVVAIAALVAAVILAYKHSATFRAIVTGAFHAVSDAAAAAFGWIRDHWKLLLAIVTGPIGLATLFVISHLADIRAAFTTVVSWVKSKAAGMWAPVQVALSSTESWIHNKWSDILGFFGSLEGRISAAASGMWGGITAAFRSAINSVIDVWNSLHFSVPGFSAFGKHVGGFTVGVPAMHHLGAGGVITAGGSVVVGDRGEEIVSLPAGAAVRPLTPAERSGGQDGGLLGTIAIDVTQDGRVIQSKLLRLRRMNGGGGLGFDG